MSGPLQYLLRKDAANVNFDLTITSTTQTITMKTKYVVVQIAVTVIEIKPAENALNRKMFPDLVRNMV